MAPKRVAKVASKPGSKKSAPVPTYKNGEPKVKWIHYAPEHSKKRPWRIQITGMVCFLGFYFVLLKLYFLFPFVRRRSTPSPPSSSRSFVSISSKQSPSKKPPLRIFSFHFYLDRWCTRVSRLWWRTLLSYLQALLFFFDILRRIHSPSNIPRRPGEPVRSRPCFFNMLLCIYCSSNMS